MPASFTRPIALVVASVVLFVPASGSGQEPSSNSADGLDPGRRVVIRVGEEELTPADVEEIVRVLPPQSRAFYEGPGKHLLAQYLVRMKLLAAEARKQGLAEEPEVRQALQVAAESILADAAHKALVRSIPVEEEQVLQLYEQRREEFEQVRLRRLLIRTPRSIPTTAPNPTRQPLPEEEARQKIQDLRQQLLEGADFAELAQTYSDDLATAGAGGDMGYVGRQEIVPPVAKAAFSLPPGEVSEVLETPFGLELITVEDRRSKPLEEVRPQLEAQLRRGRMEARLKELEEQYGVEVDTQFFSGAPPAQPLPSPSAQPE